MTHHIAILDDPPVFGRSAVSHVVSRDATRAALLEWAGYIETSHGCQTSWSPDDLLKELSAYRKKARIAPKPRHQLLAPVTAVTLCKS